MAVAVSVVGELRIHLYLVLVLNLIPDPLLRPPVDLEGSDGQAGAGAGDSVLHLGGHLQSRGTLHSCPVVHFTHKIVLKCGVLVCADLPDNGPQLWNVLGVSR